MPKTNAERCRDYRKKKKANKIKKTAKSSTERVREYRERRKLLLNVPSDISNTRNNASNAHNRAKDHYDIRVDFVNVQVDTSIENSIINNYHMKDRVGIDRAMDRGKHLVPHCDIFSTAAPETRWNLQSSKLIMKQEMDECFDGERSQCSDSKYPSKVSSPSSEYVNYYENKSFTLEQLKKEYPEEKCRQSVDIMNTKTDSDSKDILKTFAKQKVKIEKTELYDVKEEDEDIEYQFTLKTERCEDQRIMDNTGDGNVDYDVPLVVTTPREIHKSFINNSVYSTNVSGYNNEGMALERNTPVLSQTNEISKCRYCDDRFPCPDDMEAHVSYVHGKVETFDCELCGKRFKRLLNLKRHVLLMHRHTKPQDKVNRIYSKCKSCHTGEKSEEMTYRCDSCDGVYKSKQTLRLHIRRMHYDYGRLFECWCGKKFRSPIHLNVHKRMQHVRKVNNQRVEHKCKLCEAVFKVKQSLTHHVMRIHYDYGRTFQCPCGKQFRSPIHLHEHERLRHQRRDENLNNDKYQCDACKKFFKTKQCLIVHIKRIHYDYGRLFECWCGKQFRSPIQLNVHKKAQHVLLYGGFKFCF